MSRCDSLAIQLLLDCAACPEIDHAGLVKIMQPEDWAMLLQMARRTRMAPLLAHNLLQVSAQACPPPIVRALKEAERSAALASLAQGPLAARTLSLLGEAGFAPIALKGARLAHLDYPQPHLRPLRDLDILVAPEHAVAARQFLIDRLGFVPHPGASDYGLDHGHQLPEVWEPETGLVVEIHHRLAGRPWDGEEALIKMVRSETTTLNVMGVGVEVPSALANTLHLIEHAGLHHRFSNGPQVLADLHFALLATGSRGAELVELARELGLIRSLELLGAVASAHGAAWPDQLGLDVANVPPEMVERARYAMLADDETARVHEQMYRRGRPISNDGPRLPSIPKIWRPDPHELARISGEPADSLRKWLGYPSWLAEKGTRFLRGKLDSRVREAHPGQVALFDWLAG